MLILKLLEIVVDGNTNLHTFRNQNIANAAEYDHHTDTQVRGEHMPFLLWSNRISFYIQIEMEKFDLSAVAW